MIDVGVKLPLLVAALLFLLPTITQSRLHSAKLSIFAFRRAKGWQFLERMNMQEGKMQLNMNLKLQAKESPKQSEFPMQLVAIPDALWQQEVDNKCIITSQPDPSRPSSIGPVFVYDLNLAHSTDLSAELIREQTLSSPETYNFVLRDCGHVLLKQSLSRESKLLIELDIRSNNQHQSHTESYYGWLLPLLLLWGGLTQWRLYIVREEEGQNWLRWLLKGSLWCGMSGMISKWWGYTIYAYGNGSEYAVFDYFYLILSASADSVIMVLLLLLAFGWTITFNNHRQFDLYVPLACMLGVVNILMTMLNKVTDGEVDKYHMFDTIPAYIMVGFRALALLVFIGGIAKSLLQLNKTQTKLTKYFYHLSALGCIYMLFVPFLMLTIGWFPAGHRKQVLFFGIEAFRYSLTLWLAILGTSKSSSYRKLINSSFMEKGDKYY